MNKQYVTVDGTDVQPGDYVWWVTQDTLEIRCDKVISYNPTLDTLCIHVGTNYILLDWIKTNMYFSKCNAMLHKLQLLMSQVNVLIAEIKNETSE